MQRMTFLLVLGVAFAVTACGSSAAKVDAPSTTGATTASTTSSSVAATTTTSAPKALADACTLAATADVTAALGAAPSGPGRPTQVDTGYVTCDWSATPPGASNANSLSLAVVEKKTPDQQGFSVPTDLPDSHPVAGLGDKATFYSRSGTFSALTLIADKGKFTLAITGQYGGAGPTQAASETTFVAVARKVFVALGA